MTTRYGTSSRCAELVQPDQQHGALDRVELRDRAVDQPPSSASSAAAPSVTPFTQLAEVLGVGVGEALLGRVLVAQLGGASAR